jgi:hypothetical protein
MNNFKKIAVLVIVFLLLGLLSHTLKFEEVHYYGCKGIQTDGESQSEFSEVVLIREYFMGSKAVINAFEQAQCSKEKEEIRCATEISGDNFNIIESKSEVFDKTNNAYSSEIRNLDKNKGVDSKILIKASCSKLLDKTLRVGRDKE